MLDSIYHMTSRLLFVRNVDGSDYIIILSLHTSPYINFVQIKRFLITQQLAYQSF